MVLKSLALAAGVVAATIVVVATLAFSPAPATGAVVQPASANSVVFSQNGMAVPAFTGMPRLFVAKGETGSRMSPLERPALSTAAQTTSTQTTEQALYKACGGN